MRRFASPLALLAMACSPETPSVTGDGHVPADEVVWEVPTTGVVLCRVSVERPPLALPVITVDRDHEHCGDQITNPVLRTETPWVRDAVVSVRWPGSLEPEEPKDVRIEGKGCLLLPRVQLARAGDTLVVGSGDDITHNPHGWLDGETTVFNFTVLNPSFSFRKPLRDPGRIRIDCDTHKWMRAYIIVREHPFTAMTNGEGIAELRVPTGRQTLEVWHEVLGTKEVVVEVGAGERVSVDVTFDLVDRRLPEYVPPTEEPWDP